MWLGVTTCTKGHGWRAYTVQNKGWAPFRQPFNFPDNLLYRKFYCLIPNALWFHWLFLSYHTQANLMIINNTNWCFLLFLKKKFVRLIRNSVKFTTTFVRFINNLYLWDSVEQCNITLGTYGPSKYPQVTINSDLGRGRLAGETLERDSSGRCTWEFYTPT